MGCFPSNDASHSTKKPQNTKSSCIESEWKQININPYNSYGIPLKYEENKYLFLSTSEKIISYGIYNITDNKYSEPEGIKCDKISFD